jgi:hypothetical protein
MSENIILSLHMFYSYNNYLFICWSLKQLLKLKLGYSFDLRFRIHVNMINIHSNALI